MPPDTPIAQPAVFDRRFYGAADQVTRIGSGALGGKASGLVSVSEAIRTAMEETPLPGMPVRIPHMTVITTELFDTFMEKNRLREVDFEELSDESIAHLFQKSSLPPNLVGDIRALAEEIRRPLAVRSSGLLEDTMYRPFAGVYGTKMIPNNQPSVDTRFQKLAEAIKLVYASMFFSDARRHIETVDKEGMQKEKMAVIIQEIVGARHGDRFYPAVSGVARSFNFYPHGHALPEEGVVDLALGLGKSVVDGEKVWSYSPAHPKAPPPYNNISDLMKNTQTEFWAVNMGRPPAYNPIRETEYLKRCALGDAEADGVLALVASTYVADADRIVPGTGTAGPRVIDFAPLLTLNEWPFNDIVRALVKACEKRLNEKVEIEFALTPDPKEAGVAHFGFLQVRPMVVSGGAVEVPLDQLLSADAVVASENVLGNGANENISDIVYVRPDLFEPIHGGAAAMEIEKINNALVTEGRPYLLMGFGRIGTSDPWRGIPGAWHCFSGARVIVEVQRSGMETTFSQGSHFFHNLTSLEIFYFSVPSEGRYPIDWAWLEQLTPVTSGQWVRHVRTQWPLLVKVDGRIRRGVVLRHESR